MKRYPARESSRVERADDGKAIFVCGIQINANQTEPVSLRSRHHPGFGMVTMMRNRKPVPERSEWVVHDYDKSKTLMWYELWARKNPRARWEVVVNGPLSGYTLRRIRSQWYVTETNGGFA